MRGSVRSFVEALELWRRRHQGTMPPVPTEDEVPPWTESLAPTTGDAVVVLDVYNSRSDTHIVTEYCAAKLGIPVVPFSYRGQRQPYVQLDTEKSILASAKVFAEYLPTRGTNRVFPVGVSGGGVVAVLGTAKWVAEATLPSAALAERVPCVILVAPGFSPPPEILPQYEEFFRNLRLDVPEVVLQMCDEDSEAWRLVQLRIAEAFAVLAWAGIKVRVIHWPPDVLCPYPWDSRAGRVGVRLVQAHRLAPHDLHSPSQSDPAVQARGTVYHLQFCRHSRTVQKVRTLIAVHRA